MPIEALNNILNKEIIQDFDTLKGEAILKEYDCRSKTKPICIQGVPTDTIVFKLDRKISGAVKKSYYISTYKGIQQSCDYVIITRIEGQGHIILCELKSDSGGGWNQLIHTKPFIDYLKSLVNVHENIKMENFKKHFILFSTSKRLNKGYVYPSNITKKEYRGEIIKLLGNPTHVNLLKILK